MQKWVAKAIVQKGISFLPGKHRVNYLFQKYITKGVLLTDEHLELKLIHARDHINFFREENGKAFAESNCIELGTGWYPVVPIVLYLNGFAKIYSLDIRPWMNQESMLTCIQLMVDWHTKGKLQKFIPNLDEERWNALLDLVKTNPSMTQICDTLQMELVIADARNLKFADGSIDYFCSNNTFEHIFTEVLDGILKEFARLAHGRSIMSHFIDLSDHFAHMDSSITIYNFLRYSEKQWQRIDNDIQPQNRLRWPDYLKLYSKLGIPQREALVRKGDEQALATVPLSDTYKNYNVLDLAISHGYLISNFASN